MQACFITPKMLKNIVA